MGQTNKQAKLKLFAEVDEATLQRSIAHFRKLEAAERSATDAMTDRIQKTRQSLSASIANAKQENIVSAEVERAIDKQIKSREQLIATIDKQANAERNQLLKGSGVSTESSPVASSSGRGGRASSALSALGSILPGISGDIARFGGNVARLGEQISKAGLGVEAAEGGIAGLGASIGELAIAAPIAVIAIAAMAIALDGFIKQVKSLQDQLNAAIDADLEKNRLIQTATTEQIQANLVRLEADRKAVDVTLETAIAAQEAAEAVGGLQGAIADLADFLGLFGTKAKREELQKLRDQDDLAIKANRDALSSSEVKARDAAESQKKLAEETTRSSDSTAKQSRETDKAAQSSKEAAKAQQKQAEATQQTIKATNALADLYKSVIDKGRAAAQQLAKTEEQRLADIAALNTREGERAVDEARERARNEARDTRRAAYDKARAEIEGRDEAFEASINQDFGALGRIRRGEKRNAALEALDTRFNAQESGISDREHAEDLAIQRARDLAAINARADEARRTAAQSELEIARAAVAEYFKAKGLIGNVAAFSDALIMNFYRQLQQMARNGVNTMQPMPASQPTFTQPAVPSKSNFGTPGGGFQPTGGGFQPTSGYSGTIQVTVPIGNVNDTATIARIAGQATEVAVNKRLRGITRS